MQIVPAKIANQHFIKIAVVVSRFNEEITQRLHDGAVKRLQDMGFNEDQYTVAWVPGAVEIPFIAQRFAATKQYAAVICLGAVIRGDTTHYDYVCQQVSFGCQKVALEKNIPVIFGVLTTENEEQALERTGGTHGHKGSDAVDAALDMISVLQQIG